MLVWVALSQYDVPVNLEESKPQQVETLTGVDSSYPLEEDTTYINQKQNLKLYLMALDERKDTYLTESVIDVIINKCYEITDNGKKCVEDIIWVSNAESSIFKRGKNNNYLWVMKCQNGSCSVRPYSSLEQAVEHRIELYQKNNWYKFTHNSGRVGRYCASACTNRYKAFDKWVKELYFADISTVG